jgi:outer membrane protein assembly factor BamE (lipoprotein component of BamABCDE complex)
MSDEFKRFVWDYVSRGQRVNAFFIARKLKVDIILAESLCQWAWRCNAHRWFRIRCGLEDVDANLSHEFCDINLSQENKVAS